MKVNLRQKPFDNVFENVIEIIKSDTGIQSAYNNHQSRIISGVYTSLIEHEEKAIGYINLTPESTREFLLLDIGIIEKYRGKGYSELALRKLLYINFKQYIIAQVKNSNIPSNKMANKVGINVCNLGDNNIYLLQSDREVEFREEDGIQKLKTHFLSQIK